MMFQQGQYNGKRRGPVLQNDGFTLIELSIVILIIGITFIPIMRLFNTYIVTQKVEDTKTNISKVTTALSIFSPLRFPCPSDRSLTPNDANYGADVCQVTGFDATLAGIPVCNTTGQEQGICKAAGARDTEADTDTTVGNNKEFVLIGGVPRKSGTTIISGITSAYSLDGWGRQMSYAVSYTSSDPNRTKGFDRYKNGVVKVVDEFLINTAGTDSDAQFVVFSHGPTGLGSFSPEGTRRDCDVTTRDGGNCNGDSTFVQGIGSWEGAGATFYDDAVLVKSAMSGDLWFNVTDGTPNNLPTDHMKPLFTGAVGVNKIDPGSAPLPSGISDLSAGNGGIMLDVGGSVKAGAVRTDALCDLNGTYCLNTQYSTGFFSQRNTGTIGANVSGRNDCPDGAVMTGVSGGGVVCAYPAVTAGAGAQTKCPLGTWVSSVRSDRSIICTNGIICPGGLGCEN